MFPTIDKLATHDASEDDIPPGIIESLPSKNGTEGDVHPIICPVVNVANAPKIKN